VEKLARLGFEPAPSTPAQFSEVLRSDLKKYGQLVKRTGIAAEQALRGDSSA